MRIVHIESGRHLYGGAAQVRDLLDGLAAAGVDSTLVCARGSELARAVRRAAVVELPMGGDLDVRLIGRLRRTLARLDPDLVHVHSRRGAELYGGLACALERAPAVLTRRVDSYEPRCWARLKYRPYRAIVALSRAIESQLVAGAGLPAARVRRIPSAVDAERWRPDPSARSRLRAAFDWPADALVVGVVAQLIARKGHARLLRVLPALVARHPVLRVACFGRGPLEAALRSELARLGLDRHVRLAGFRDDLDALLPGLDVLAHPAEREGLGVAVLEASSCGVPVLACAAGGIVDAIEHERTGLLVAVNDAEALGAALERLIGDPALRRQLGAAARARVERDFSVAGMIDRHVRLYADVAGAAAVESLARSAA
jgi:glycosyltransferase involved in cell wall biosynthesis